VYIIDDKIAYVGSANVTKAGLRQLNDANYEAGILTENPELVTSIKDFFSMVWEGVD
jgi:phosphatidylserine/phosphatidylglycerophosphate/cardiolipin synthase-like enzyme